MEKKILIRVLGGRAKVDTDMTQKEVLIVLSQLISVTLEKEFREEAGLIVKP